jgi:hypothetical protein
VEFDALLWNALDGDLSGPERERFEAHRATCASCGPIFAEAQAGMSWLHALDEVEPPATLVHHILVATTGQTQALPTAARPVESWWQRIAAPLRPVLAPVLQPKFATAFAMAFFSITLLLNIAGVSAKELKHVDLRPSALVRDYYETQGRLVKYYENLRFVYELESRVQQLKQATTPEDKAPAPERHEQKNKSGQPDRKYQNYSRDEVGATMARLFEPAFAHGGSARRNS